MKILKLFMFLLLSSQIVTYAGSFTQDPLVLELRNSFSKSKSPTLNELRLGKYWECKTHSTMPNDFSIENNYFKFYLDGELRTSMNNHIIFYKFENQLNLDCTHGQKLKKLTMKNRILTKLHQFNLNHEIHNQ